MSCCMTKKRGGNDVKTSLPMSVSSNSSLANHGYGAESTIRIA